MKTPDYELRLDSLFAEAFGVEHDAMMDWIKVKFELKDLRKKAAQLKAAKGQDED